MGRPVGGSACRLYIYGDVPTACQRSAWSVSIDCRVRGVDRGDASIGDHSVWGVFRHVHVQ